MWKQDEKFRDILNDQITEDKKYSANNQINFALNLFRMNHSNFKFMMNKETISQIF